MAGMSFQEATLADHLRQGREAHSKSVYRFHECTVENCEQLLNSV